MQVFTRKTWWYKGCKIVPINEGFPRRFRLAYRKVYWRIDFPNQTWIHVEFKQDARDYIAKYLAS